MNDLLGYDEMAKRLGVSVTTLYSWVRSRRIPCVYLGPRAVRFDPTEVQEWLKSHRRAAYTHGDE
ncbi:MAG: DNA-binding protein [Deltaproteobacteria bacterium]|nr:MAG: DNA-binding protein [Deltaproteobacteria bacterium]